MPSTHRFIVLIADLRRAAARGLAAAVEESGDFVAHASCHEPQELLVVLGSRRTIDAVVIDAEMFGGDAAESVDTVRRLAPGAPVLVLTTRVDERVLEAVAGECVSCVSAYSDAPAIVSALARSSAGRLTCRPRSSGRSRTGCAGRHPRSGPR